MSVLRKLCYYSRWQCCHLGHTTCSTFRNYSLCLVAWKWFCYWKDCHKVSAYAKPFSTVLRKEFFSHGKLQEVLVDNPNLSYQTNKKIFICWPLAWLRVNLFMSNGSYACYCKTLVVRHFNFEFILFVYRNVIHLVNIIGFNGKHIEAYLNSLHLERKKYLLVLILTFVDHFNKKALLSIKRWNKMIFFLLSLKSQIFVV